MWVIFVLVLAILSGFVLGGLVGAPWVPTRSHDLAEIFAALDLQPDQTFYDLGCGDGRAVVTAAQAHAKAIGIEINPVMWLIATLRTLRYSNAKIRLGNLWQYPVRDADAVLVFQMPRVMEQIEAKLAGELKPGTKVVSYAFPMPQRQALHRAKSWSLYQY